MPMCNHGDGWGFAEENFHRFKGMTKTPENTSDSRRVNPSDFSRWRAGYPDLSRFFEPWALFKTPHKGILLAWVILGDQWTSIQKMWDFHYPWNGIPVLYQPTLWAAFLILLTAHMFFFSKCGIPKTMGVNMFQHQIIPNILSLGCFWVASGELT